MKEPECLSNRDISFSYPNSIGNGLVQKKDRRRRRSKLSKRFHKATFFNTLHQKLFYAQLIETLKCRNISEGLTYTSLRLTFEHIQLQKNYTLTNPCCQKPGSLYRLDQTPPLATNKNVPKHTPTTGKWNLSIFRIVFIMFTTNLLNNKWV